MDLTALLDVVLAPLTEPSSRTWLPALAVAAAIALVLQAVRRRQSICGALWSGLSAAVRLLRHPSTLLDVQLLLSRQLLRALGLLPAIAGSWFLATWVVRSADAVVAAPSLSMPTWSVTLAYTAVLFIAWDASRFALHLLMHRVPALWAFHQLHHSAEVLTPLTFHRLHPLESVLYQLRGLLVTTAVVAPFYWVFRGQLDLYTVLGVHGVGFVFSTTTGNLRHSHVWLRYGPHLERWLISPAQHQLHHSADLEESESNYGTWLAIWDRMAGTLRIAGRQPPAAFGLDGPRNHGNDLISAWFGPLAQVTGVRAVGWLALPALVAITAPADASEQVDGSDDSVGKDSVGDSISDDAAGDEDDDFTVIVRAENGVPTVAGSAQIVDEEALERHEYNDVGKVLVTVPGVYVRGEDGYGLRPNVGIRGANSDRSAKITLLEDGIPLAPAPYAAPAAYYFPMTTRLVGIEVFKGPAAIQHGPQTVGGAVNLRTRRVPTEGPAAGIDLAGGLYQTGKVHGWAGSGGSRGGVLAEVVHLGTGGFKELDSGASTGFQRTELMFKARANHSHSADRRSAIELKLGAARELSNESYLGLTSEDIEATPYRRYAATALDKMAWQRSLAHLSWDLRLGRDLQIRTTAYHHHLSRTWTKFNRFSGGPATEQVLKHPDAGAAAVYMGLLRGSEDSETAEQRLMIGTNDRRFHSGGIQTVARWRAAGDVAAVLWEAGARLHFDDVVRLHSEDAHVMVAGDLEPTSDPTVVTRDTRSTARAVALHTQGKVSIGRVHLQPGARVEWVHTAQAPTGKSPDDTQDRLHLLPGMGALVELTPQVALFAGSHRGFSPVAPGQAQQTRPEVSWNHELGLRAIQGERHAEATAFVSDYRNLTGDCTISGGCDGAQVGQQFSAGKVLVAGVESMAADELPLTPGLRLPIRLSYTYTTSRFAEDFHSDFPQFGDVHAGDRLPYVPAHQGSISVGLDHDDAAFSLAGSARSGMLDTAGDEPGDYDVAPQFLLDAAVRVRVHRTLWTYATASNLTGTHAPVSWRPLGARPAAPRLLTVGIKAQR